jgi:transcriptional regulator with XRE-family HTH domain
MENKHIETLRRKRREFGYSQEYIAEKLGISQKAYSDIENGKTSLKNETRIKLAKILDLKPSDLCSIAHFCSNVQKQKNEELIKLLTQYKIEIPEHLL